MRGKIALFLLICGSVFSLRASLPDTLLAHANFAKGDSLRKHNQYLASTILLVKARDEFIAAAQNDQPYCWERAIRAAGLTVGNFLMLEQFGRGDSLARNSIAAFPEGALKKSKKTRSLYGNWARCLYYLQNYEQAIQLYEGLLKMEQARVPQDSNVIQQVLTDITYSYRSSGRLEEAFAYNQIALDWAKSRTDTINISMLYRSMAGYLSYFGEIEKSNSLFKAAVDVLEAYSQADTRSLMMAHGDYSTSLLNQGKIEEALRYAKLTLKEAEAYAGPKHRDYATSLDEIGYCYLAMRDFRLAKRYFLQSLDIYLQTVGEYHTSVADLYVRLSKIHIAQLEYEVGLEYLEKAVRIREKILGPNNPYTVNHFGNLGWAYLEMGRYEESRQIYEEAVARALQFEPVNEYAVAYMENNLALAYQYSGRFSEAEQTIKRAIARKKAIFEPTHRQISLSLTTLASLYLHLEQYDKAKRTIDECIGITANALAYDSIFHAESLVIAADWAYQTKAYPQGLNYLKKAESLLQTNSIVVRFERLELLEVQIKTLIALDKREEALQKIAIADQEIQEILPRQQQRAARLKLQEIAHNLYLKGVALCYQMHQKSQANSWLKQAFHYAESAKAAVLYQEMYELSLQQKGLVPPAITQLETDIRSRQRYLNQQLLELQSTANPTDDEIAEIESELFKNQVQTDSLFSVIENNYPQYYQLKIKTPRFELPFIQSQLTAKQSLIEYLVDEDKVWVFVISAEGVDLLPLRGTLNLNQQIDQLRYALIDPEQGSASHQQYLTHAADLYQKLVQGISGQLKSELIIIPDDILSYLPFECLLSKPATAQQSTPQLSFWLKEKSISYAYSASLWAQSRKQRRYAPKSLLAVAPKFDAPDKTFAYNRSDYLGPLMASRAEAQSVAQIWQGETLLDSMASVQNFASMASQYQIIHLATHGKILDEGTGRSFLAFYSPDDTLRLGERSYPQVKALYLADLFSLRLRSDLVVLSACETGLGKLYKGEGVASLARGFTYAGAASILNTLWSVSDEGSKILMERFYFHLNQAHSRVEALRLAKLDLIKTRPEYSQPFYWAGYILVGDERKVELPRRENGVIYLLLLLSLGLVGGMLVQWQKQKAAG